MYKGIFQGFKKKALPLALAIGMFACSEEELVQPDPVVNATPVEEPTTHATVVSCSNCTYVVPANQNIVDGKALNLKPGAVIGLNAATKYKNLIFRNIVGTSTNPIIIKNCGGTATLTATGYSYAVKTENSKHFVITGGTVSKQYGIRINGGRLGITLDKLSTNFKVDHIEIFNQGFAGIMAKTDPSCDGTSVRGKFLMENVTIHDNYIHNTGGEGLYIGNSFYASGMNTSCGKLLPHEIHNLKVYNNIVRYTAWDGIQIGSATKGAQIYNNTVENFGTANKTPHNNGVQLGEGTGGLFFNNFIKNGPGHGLTVLGYGDNLVHNNVIVGAGNNGIFCDERYSPGDGFKFINNTIINPKNDGIRIYADLVRMNVIVNNIIVNPGSFGKYTGSRTTNDSYVYKLSSNVKLQLANNYFTRDINAVKFVNAGASNYRLMSGSPAVNKGFNIGAYGILKDFYADARLQGSAYDIGASEY